MAAYDENILQQFKEHTMATFTRNVAFLLVVILVPHLFGQETREERHARIGAAIRAHTAELEQLTGIANEVAQSLIENPAKRGIQAYAMPSFSVVMVDNLELNAYATPSTNTVTVTSILVRVMSKSELAFVIAHEIGHLQDANCTARGVAQRLSGVSLQRMCEAAADQIGVQYLLAAGYSPFEAAGAMGKLMMLDPGQSSILGIIVGRFVSDHPVTVDRIKQMASDARLACEDRPEMCRQ
jgi:predicted Zn-dependent protease